MTPRQSVLNDRLKNICTPVKQTHDGSAKIGSERFGENVFNLSVMQKILPKEIYQNVQRAMQGFESLKPEHADTLAVAIKEWALSHGATHYSHWFQPLTGLYAEKHDAFIDWDYVNLESGALIEKFSGKELVQGEPDASSFPSGGLRSTYEARGYTGWDPASPPFIWKRGKSATLCIPSVFFSWTGDVLDTKIPLLRSDQMLNVEVLKLLELCKIPAKHAFSTLGLEQEYFVIDRMYRNLRPDLVLGGRTVFGASPPKGQELQDHYFGAVKDRILAYMCAFEDEALSLGIPVKTRHNEVAPAQHEVAPIYERASRAIDHNILLMELMRKIAADHHLSCLLHEKPFARINGSGKHMNWSVSTDTGLNLLDPTDSPGNNLSFLILLAAILRGVYKHNVLLRASIGSASNDFRLGGHEAPPAIMSIYLGKELEEVLERIETTGFNDLKNQKGQFNLGLLHLPNLMQDTTDRNRTSPFAFTGNKFEFRALGSSASPAFSATVLNLIVAESLREIVSDIKSGFEVTKNVLESAFIVLKKTISESKPIRFAGDNYSEAWVKEAEKRGLPNIQKSPEAFKALIKPETFSLFKDVLTELELKSRYEIALEAYEQAQNIEVNLALSIYDTQIFPAAIKSQKDLAKSIEAYKTAVGDDGTLAPQIKRLKEVSTLLQAASKDAEDLKALRDEAMKLKGFARAHSFAQKVIEKNFELREKVDALEELIDDSLWPLPKYWEILFNV